MGGYFVAKNPLPEYLCVTEFPVKGILGMSENSLRTAVIVILPIYIII